MLQRDTPSLLFFRSTPKALADRPSLASSLQSFESCLCLLALQRYPPALVACASAVESALQVRFPGKRRAGLNALIAHAIQQCPVLSVTSANQIEEMRHLRNRFVHTGFGPGDDSAAAAALLFAGWPLLIAIFDAIFSFDLCDALAVPFGSQLALAIEVFAREREQQRNEPLATLRALGHLIRWSFRESMMAPWELHALDPAQSYDLQLDVTMRLREQAERQLEPSWRIDCPICDGPESLVCQLDDELLSGRQVSLNACRCAECGLTLSGTARALLNAMCHDAIEGCRELIFGEFGIEPA